MSAVGGKFGEAATAGVVVNRRIGSSSYLICFDTNN